MKTNRNNAANTRQVRRPRALRRDVKLLNAALKLWELKNRKSG
jgi:hypothetical protein